MKTDNIKRLKERVLESGGEVFFGDITPEPEEGHVGNTVMPVVTACPFSETEDIRIRAVKVDDNGNIVIIGEDMDGDIIDPLDINDFLEDGIDDITNAIETEEDYIWLRVGMTVKGSKQQIQEILADTDRSSGTLWNLLKAGKYEIDGETYIPSCCIEEYNDDNDTDFDTAEINFFF